ncbi:MAG: hypothetical protein ACFBSC_19190 [Microcoleaceae cyanobacterium]
MNFRWSNRLKALSWVSATLLLTLGSAEVLNPTPAQQVTCAPTRSPIAPEKGSLGSASGYSVQLMTYSSPQVQQAAKSNTCQQDAFAEAVRFAIRAANLVQTAKSRSDWDEVARHWVQAVAWMQAVPPNSVRRAYAERKVVEYMRNLAYAQKQAARTLASNNFPSLNSDLLDRQIQLYLSYLQVEGKPDVMIVGSSRALQGVDPKQLQRSLAARGYKGLEVFNFGVNGATAQVVDYLLRQLLTPEQLPRLVIWADGVRAFNSGRIDRTYNSILESPGHQRLASGQRPQLKPSQPQGKVCHQFPQPCLVKFPEDQLSQSNLALEAVPLIYTPDFDALEFNPSEFETILASADAINSKGFMPMYNQYNPNTYYQKHPYVAGAYDGDYRAFTLGGVQAGALSSVASFLQSQKIPLVFVNLPLTDDYLDGTRWSAELAFHENMRYLSREYGFIFVEMSDRVIEPRYFVDPSHLNLYGANLVAQKLAAESVIPWPR